MAVRAVAAGRTPVRVADDNSRNAALTLACAQPGDTLLYLLLPLHHAAFGVSLAGAGLLLAANRLVRIAGYRMVARLYAERGPRAACLAAALGSLLSTLAYSALSGLWSLLVARLFWGVSFAAMNIATQALATSETEGAARRSGRMRSIVAAGPCLGLVAGAAIDQLSGPRVAFLVLAVAALAAFPFAARLPRDGEGRSDRIIRPRLRPPSRLDAWSFIQGMTLDGLFVLGMSVLARAALPAYAALAAGGALALRYVGEILLGPVGGGLAERFGPRRVLTALSVSTAAGLALIGIGGLWSGAALVVCLRGLIQPIPGPVVALENPGRARVPALAALATWRDLGAGTGPLVAGMLLPVIPRPVLYGGAAALLAISAAAVAFTGRQPPR
jgi:MFS transporter, DHA1 family, inner membrane transport protein